MRSLPEGQALMTGMMTALAGLGAILTALTLGSEVHALIEAPDPGQDDYVIWLRPGNV